MPNLCETCGKQFFVRKHPHQRFCSRACCKVPQKRQIQRTCVICGKTFSRQGAKISDYCSAPCFNQSLRKDIAVAFWAKVEKTATDCWLWTGSKHQSGHGLFTMGKDGRTIGAHRFAYEQVYGPIPYGLIVCHHCDNPSCVRPDHLFLGTRAINNQDRDIKGRQAKGQSIWRSKLTEDDICAIRSASGKRGFLKALAEHYGVAQRTISAIRHGRLWKHI